jgi:hypothetical protein
MPQKRPTQRAPTRRPCAAPGCKKSFVLTKGWRKFCSDKCRTASWVEQNIGAAKRLQVEVDKLRAQLAKLSAK